MEKLKREFYANDALTVAQQLLGKYLIHVVNKQEKIGRIVEVEAYLGPHDLASHASKGITPRTKIMYGPPGFAYVYLIYGMYHCMNVVTAEEGFGSAVLIRALEPIQHITERTQGPGLLCRAMHINKELNGHDLLSDNFYLAISEDSPSFTMVTRPRIGVAYAKEWAEKPLRFYIQGNPFVSKL
ncbi:DNA-3-methyladenine glycosylase [Legionella beliardensis]|uniref:Putative 3-methyladenine DNA glycosylase n=1 Tax=Legionella beliardensis TaxID=91822 RepID=A0A378I1E2_9GAMM|nr:DNA-3-methyladenine glycosylase [Legionella beliardensis]STX28803.1 DNA-3-methyladenine glycosylase [Legionella beliardensis]